MNTDVEGRGFWTAFACQINYFSGTLSKNWRNRAQLDYANLCDKLTIWTPQAWIADLAPSLTVKP